MASEAKVNRVKRKFESQIKSLLPTHVDGQPRGVSRVEVWTADEGRRRYDALVQRDDADGYLLFIGVHNMRDLKDLEEQLDMRPELYTLRDALKTVPVAYFLDTPRA